MKYLAAFFLVFALHARNVYSYSVLTHEAIVDSVWKDTIEPLLRQRFPRATAQELRTAHAYAYGGTVIQDMGYYPFGSHFFTDLTHYVRSGDFVIAMLRDAADLNEYAFALGALAHYAADTNGHPIGINRAVPLLYPKLQRKYGPEVTYADDAASHIKTEFGFDVLQVAKGRYTSDTYHAFIGFEVSKPLLEKAFRDTYGLELKDVFGALDLGIGTYRKVVSGLIPKMTEVAWSSKHDEIVKSQPGTTRETFLYNLSRANYEKTWGTGYKGPRTSARLLAFVMRIVPKIGPFRALSFRAPTPETEKLFMDSFNVTLERYRSLLAAERTKQTQAADINLDVGKPTSAGMYKLADKTYAKLVHELAKHNFAGPPQLRANILKFYETQSAAIEPKLRRELEMLKTAPSVVGVK